MRPVMKMLKAQESSTVPLVASRLEIPYVILYVLERHQSILAATEEEYEWRVRIILFAACSLSIY